MYLTQRTMKNPQVISICEFGTLSVKWTKTDGEESSREHAFVSGGTFSALEKCIVDGENNEDSIVSLGSHKRYGRIIKIRNYTGVIQTSDGTTIEILPKIYRAEDDEATTRKNFIKMLKSYDASYKNINEAHLTTQAFPILEIFIKAFLDEVSLVLRMGIKKHYRSIEENQKYLQWRLKIADNIRYNAFHKERFFVEHDEFTEDVPENRLIKSTLIKLSTIGKKHENQRRIGEYMFAFDMISESHSTKRDFKALGTSRLHSYYTPCISWARIFLREESIVSMAGKNIAFSLLFPMEKVLESYVARQLKERRRDWHVETQDSEHHLVEEHKWKKMFWLRPDIVVKDENGEVIIIDTKWKIINEKDGAGNYGISQWDMYQLYAYAKKYDTKKLYLIYPRTESFREDLSPFWYQEEGEKLEVIGYDVESDKCVLFDRWGDMSARMLY